MISMHGHCSVYFEFELSPVLKCLVSFIPTNTSPLTFFLQVFQTDYVVESQEHQQRCCCNCRSLSGLRLPDERQNLAGLKSVSLTFQSPTRVNKDPCRYSFNFRDRKDCSCRSWNRESKSGSLTKFFQGQRTRQLFWGQKLYVRKIHSKSGKNNAVL